VSGAGTGSGTGTGTGTGTETSGPSIDERLLGGKWYQLAHSPMGAIIKEDLYFLEITKEDDELLGTISVSEMMPVLSDWPSRRVRVRSQEGDVYALNSNDRDIRKIMSYEFISEMPDSIYFPVGWRGEYNRIAANGNIIKITIYDRNGLVFDDGRYELRWIFRRYYDEDDEE
jgi:hypothetical protein